MTISTTTSRQSYNGNGVTTVFSVPFRFFANTDLVVQLVTISTGAATTLTLTTHYTVTGADDEGGGSLTMLTAPAVGERLVIRRVITATQEVDYVAGDSFPAETHERALDRLTMLVQQQDEATARTLTFPTGDTTSGELPSVAARAGKLLGFNSSGDLVVSAPASGSAAELTLDLAGTGAGEGAEMIGSNDGASGTLWTTVAGFITRLMSSAGSALVGFIQSGTGAVARTLQAKVRESVSFRDFGAVGDGVANDTAALQAAINSGARLVKGVAGDTYLINSTLLVDNAYPTEVDLNGSTLKLSTGVNMMRLQNATHWVHGGTFDGAGINAQVIGVIVQSTSTYSRVTGNRFVDIGACAIQVQDGAHHTRVEGNDIDNCGNAAVTVSPFYTSIYVNITEGVQVIGNRVFQCNWGIYMRGTALITPVKDFVVANNYIIGQNISASQGISNQYPYNGVITGNVCKDFGDNAIDCYGGVYVTISGNKSEGCKDGVFVGHSSTRQMTVIGNTSVNDDRAVRVLDTAADVVVSGNVCRNPTVDGIEVGSAATGTCVRVVVSDNRIDCNGAGVNGIVFDNTEMCAAIGNSVRQPDQIGISLANSNLTTVSSNQITDASHSASNTYDGILNASTSNRAFIDNNVIYGLARYGVHIAGGTGSSVRGNRGRSLGTAITQNSGTSTTLADNLAV